MLTFSSMAPIIYTDDGKKVSQQLWKETMAELAFADVEKIVQGIARQSTDS